jgi:hypothetical protein
VQLFGRKRFLLLPPAAARAVKLYPRLHVHHRQARLNLSHPSDARKLRRGGSLNATVAEILAFGKAVGQTADANYRQARFFARASAAATR